MINGKLKALLLSFSLCSLLTPPALLHAQIAVLHDRVGASEQVSFDIWLPLQHRDLLEIELRTLQDPSSANYRKWLSPAEFLHRFGPAPEAVAAVQAQLSTLGLQSSVLARRIRVTGSSSAAENLLNTQLYHAGVAHGRATIVTAKPILLTGALADAHAAIIGLNETIRPHTDAVLADVPENRESATGRYYFDDLKQAYRFPSYQAYTGKGVTIGILMFNDYNPADMVTYFGHEHLPVPNFTTINVDGGSPFNYNGTSSFEVNLDLQQSGGMAPNANILLYNLPDLGDQHVIDGLTQIISDNKADVVSMSFGIAEIFYTAPYSGGVDRTQTVFAVENDLMAQGNAQGITFISSSGDQGALAAFPVACFDDVPNCGSTFPGADYPASSPYVTGVGGTNLVTTYNPPSLNSAYISEEAFADAIPIDVTFGTPASGNYWGSGGGDSILYPQPTYQALANTGNSSVRTVPDLALHMGGCPTILTPAYTCNPDDSADMEVLNGVFHRVIGTSAAAPDFAGLTALAIERLGTRLGNENYYIYTLAFLQEIGLPIHVFKTGVPGNNGFYSTTPTGYNRVLGNGTLNGTNFLLAPRAPVAGVPQTPSNP